MPSNSSQKIDQYNSSGEVVQCLRHVVGLAGQRLLPELTDHVIYHIMLAPST